MAAKLLEEEIDYHPLLAAVVRQAILDLAHTNILVRLDAAFFFARGHYDLYADALRLNSDDGLHLLISGQARRAVENAIREEQLAPIREYNRRASRESRRRRSRHSQAV